MTPVSFELKRIIGQQGIAWKPELRRWIASAPVYITSAAKDELIGISDAGMMLPHDRMLIECEMPPQNYLSHFRTFVVQDTTGCIAYPFLRSRDGNRWTSAEVEIRYDRASGDCRWIRNPRSTLKRSELLDVAKSTIAVMFVIGDALTHDDHAQRTATVNVVQRRKFAGPGVTGWIYRIIDIEPALHRQRIQQGGTHASPRWHIRRGHWRTLPNGRRTFVRECQVGSSTTGGVIKEYRVAQEAVA